MRDNPERQGTSLQEEVRVVTLAIRKVAHSGEDKEGTSLQQEETEDIHSKE